MNGNTVRTTIRLPQDVHRRLKLEAVENGLTISDILVRRFANPRVRNPGEAFKLFDEARRSGKQIIAWKAVREERDSH